MFIRKMIVAAALMLVPAAALAQTEPAFKPGVAVSDTNPYPVKPRCWSGTAWAVCAAGGGGGGGDASAANQTAPQANAGADATKAVSVQGITGGKAVPISAAALPLPSGAATSSLQTTANSSLSTIATNTGAGRDSGGRLLPGQGAVSSTYFASLTTSAATQLIAASAGRVGLSVQVKAALTADIYLCTTQTTACSATNYDAQIPSGAPAGTTYIFLFAPNSSVYYFTTASASGVANSWSAQ